MTECLLACGADRAVQAWLQSPALQQSARLQGLAGFFNWWGGDGVIALGVLLWLLPRLLRHRQLAVVGVRGLEGLAVASAVSAIVKGFAGRARPFVTPGEPWHFSLLHGWTDAHYFSMPSGHTTATFAFAVASTMAIRGWNRGGRALWGAEMICSAIAVAWARAYTDQHWFTDVLAGATIGIVTGWLIGRWHLRRGDTAFDRVLAGAEPAK